MGNPEEGSSTGDFEKWMKGLWGWGISLSRGSVEGVSGRAPLLGNTNDEVFERYAKCPASGPPSL
jgi:tetrahydromethanopterin S-methyltransferase subunit A